MSPGTNASQRSGETGMSPGTNASQRSGETKIIACDLCCLLRRVCDLLILGDGLFQRDA